MLALFLQCISIYRFLVFVRCFLLLLLMCYKQNRNLWKIHLKWNSKQDDIAIDGNDILFRCKMQITRFVANPDTLALNIVDSCFLSIKMIQPKNENMHKKKRRVEKYPLLSVTKLHKLNLVCFPKKKKSHKWDHGHFQIEWFILHFAWQATI